MAAAAEPERSGQGHSNCDERETANGAFDGATAVWRGLHQDLSIALRLIRRTHNGGLQRERPNLETSLMNPRR
jgi:hypothetical protein